MHLLRSRGRSALSAIIVVAAAAASLVVADLSLSVKPASASVIDGAITRSEILQRAEDWYNRRGSITYNMNNGSTVWDVGSTRKYRPDCSGFIDMAWHLGSDPNTQGLVTSAYTTPVARASLLPGDALIDAIDSETGYPYHAILFGGWEDSAKTKFWYYSFGSTPIEKVRNATFSGSLAGHPYTDYAGYRYRRVVGESWPAVGTWCEYRVVNGDVNERTGPGTLNPVVTTRTGGSTLIAGSDGTVTAGGSTWRRLTDWRGADGRGGWLSHNYLTRTSSLCFTA